MQHATCQSKSLSLHTLQEFEAKDLDLDDLEDWMNSSVADGLSPPSVRVEKDGREGTNLILTIYMYIYILFLFGWFALHMWMLLFAFLQ